jgi:purine nucleoside phosphorylase
MPASNSFEEIILHADRIRKLIIEPHIIGLSVPRDFSLELISTSHDQSSEGPYPFSCSIFEGAYRILLISGDQETRIPAIRILKQLEADCLLLITSCQGLTERFPRGKYVRVVDHIGLSGTNPLSGPNDERIGPRYPNMIHAYDRIWSDKIEQAGRLMDMPLQKAVYSCVKHPSTPAEKHMLSYLGADVLGHEVVDDVIVANHCGLPVTAFGYVGSNVTSGYEGNGLSNPESLHAQQVRISQLLCRIFEEH